MNRICKTTLWLVMMFYGCAVYAQNVSNVTAEQVGKTIHVSYDLDKAADISLFVSMDGGGTYTQLYIVSGDVGKTIGPGHKTIVWDVQAEMKELHNDDIFFRVKVDANAEAQWQKQLRENFMYSSASASMVASCSIFHATSISATVLGRNTLRLLVVVFGFFKTSAVEFLIPCSGKVKIMSFDSSVFIVAFLTR